LLLCVLAGGFLRLLPPRPRGTAPCPHPVSLEEGERGRVLCLEAEEVELEAIQGVGRTAISVLGRERGPPAVRVRRGDLLVRDGVRDEVVVIPGGLPVGLRLTLGLRVDVNRASEQDLVALPRIGPVLARRIVLERARAGPFSSVADLKRVKGIGRATIRRLDPYVQVTGARRPFK
jgi:hypothetical protein